VYFVELEPVQKTRVNIHAKTAEGGGQVKIKKWFGTSMPHRTEKRFLKFFLFYFYFLKKKA
jgi:hypothetical protein